MALGFAHAILLFLALTGSIINAQNGVDSVSVSAGVPSVPSLPSAVTLTTLAPIPIVPGPPKSLTSTASDGFCTLGTAPGSLHQPSCVINCLVNPKIFGDGNGHDCTDSLTNRCVCLAAPVAAIQSIATCVISSCASSAFSSATDAGGVDGILSSDLSIATSLYSSYCASVYGSSAIGSAISSEANGPTVTLIPPAVSMTTPQVTATLPTLSVGPSSRSSTTAGTATVSHAKSNAAAVQTNGPLNRGLSGLLMAAVPVALAL